MKDFILARLKEPSTYVSLGTVLIGIGVVSEMDLKYILNFLGTVIAGLGMILPENKNTTPENETPTNE